MVALKILLTLLVIQVSKANQGWANRGQFPYHAAVVQLSKNEAFNIECSGALIRRNYVITAAFCHIGDLQNYRVALDTVNFSIQNYSQFIAISKFITHPLYKPTNGSYYENDIALVRLMEEVELSGYINIINLPQFNEVPDESRICTITTYQWLLNKSTLNMALGFYSAPFVFNKFYANDTSLPESILSISGREFRNNLKVNIRIPVNKILEQKYDDKTVLVGIVTGKNNYFTKISSHVTWIESKMNDDKRDVQAHKCWATPGQFPYHVAIVELINDTEVDVRCSGALVKENYALAAASCTVDNLRNFRVALNMTDLLFQKYSKFVGIKKFITQDPYKSIGVSYDKYGVVVVQLERKVELSQYVNVVSLPQANEAIKISRKGVITFYDWYPDWSNLRIQTALKYYSASNIYESSCVIKNELLKSLLCVQWKNKITLYSEKVLTQKEGNKRVLFGFNIENSNLIIKISSHVHWINDIINEEEDEFNTISYWEK